MSKAQEQAAKNGEKYYTVSEKNGDECKEIKLPLFISLKQNGSPYVNSSYLHEYFKITENVLYLRSSDSIDAKRYIYQNGVYRIAQNRDISEIMLSYICDFNIGLQASAPVDEAIRLLDNKSNYITHNKMNTNENIINFKNGILDINTMKLSPHSPEIYSTVQLPCNWTDNPYDTPQWDKYIESLTAGNAGYAKLLHEFAGAVISNVYGFRFKKALFVVGNQGNNGKSVYMEFLRDILGSENAVERSLARIGQRFGETAAYMTRLIYSPDMSDVSADNLDRFKELTGGDTISIEYKNKEPFGYRFNGFMGFAMNNLPKFGGDKGDHVYDRMIIMKCNNVIPENERDYHLREKLYDEREGIIYKCVQHFREVLKNGYKFTIPPECIKTLNEYKTDNSAVLEFWDECTEDRFRGDSEKYTVTEFYNAFRNWNEEQGNRHKPAMQEFKREVGNYHHTDFSKIIKRNSAGNIIVNRKLNSTGKKYLPPQRQGFY